MSKRIGRLGVLFALLAVILTSVPCTAVARDLEIKSTWAQTVVALRAQNIPESEQKEMLQKLVCAFHVESDWLEQDGGADFAKMIFGNDENLRKAMLDKVYEEIHDARASVTDEHWYAAYEEACKRRRAQRLKLLLAQCDTLVFSKHYNMGGSHYAYTEGLSDAQSERHFRPGTALCLLNLKTGEVETLIDDPKGVIRDPDVSFDGKRILFSWKKSDREDDYHLYEMDAKTREIRQLTFGLGFADYEGMYLPGGDILFTSSRCVQTTDCWHTETSSMYRCDKDGNDMRRLGFDQVATNYPQLMSDGRITYTRWEYNDRGQLYPQPLFQMNPDGTGQTEYYGNNSWFPTTILHARGIPGSHKVAAISSGHHTRQGGKLIVIDNLKGRQENTGVEYLNPRTESKAIRVDRADQHGDQYQYPYPFNEKDILVTLAARGYCDLIGVDPTATDRMNGYGVYFVNGETNARELLARDRNLSCNQQIPLKAKPRVYLRPSLVDYTQPTGTFFMQDVYIGPGLKDIPRGTIKKIRVVAPLWREADIAGNGNRGPAGGAFVSTPAACDNGAWDPKVIIGESPVHEDGSACFKVPARIPVYFQCIDDKGHCAATMRSWSTLMPGETFGCVGCHEDKNSTPAPNFVNTAAFKNGARDLDPFYGPMRGFSYREEIQPILDRHCVKCHKPGGKNDKFILTSDPVDGGRAGRIWTQSYVTLTQNGRMSKWLNWISPQSVPSMLEPYSGGACKSGIFEHLEDHNNVKLSREELDKLAAWIDLVIPFTRDYWESNSWNEGQVDRFIKFSNKRQYMESLERQNIEAMVKRQTGRDFKMPVADPNPYRNLALNPNDTAGDARNYPHASSNSEYGDNPAYLAKNCIDGRTENTGHGPKFPSWGPDKDAKDLYWMVEFGREVETDRVDIIIRADFPHDAAWTSAVLEFSDGSRVNIKLAKSAGRQTFWFKQRKTTSVKIIDLKQEEPAGWAALTEVEVWGRTPDDRFAKN